MTSTEGGLNNASPAMTSENLRNTMATVDTMKTANKEMKRQYGKLSRDYYDPVFVTHLQMGIIMDLFIRGTAIKCVVSLLLGHQEILQANVKSHNINLSGKLHLSKCLDF
jgi:hypothetical protein